MASKPDTTPAETTQDVLVIDNGTGFIKAGWAGEDAPRLVIPTMIAETQGLVGYDALHAYANYMTASAAVNASANLDEVLLTNPIERGELKDFEAMKRIWEFIFRELRVEPERCAVLLTVPPPHNPHAAKTLREKLAEYFFQHFRVPALCIFNQCVLSLFASGRTRGLVVELGEGSTYAVPVFEGYALPHATSRLALAGLDLTSHLMTSLNKAQKEHKFTDAHIDIVRDIKEKMVTVMPSSSDDSSKQYAGNSADNMFELPDGQLITIDQHSRFLTAEILFDPKQYDSKLGAGVHEMAFESIVKCDNYLQRDLYRNIVLAGGTSMVKGFGERMLNEITALDKGVHKIEIVQDSQRKHAAWIGGSMFASLGTFHHVKVTRQEYEEAADHVIHKKSF